MLIPSVRLLALKLGRQIFITQVIVAAVVAFLPSIFSLKSEEDILDINTSANRFASIK